MNERRIDWSNPAAIEAALASEGLADIDATITDSSDLHTGVGRAAMTAAGEVQDMIDFEEDNSGAEFDIEIFVDQSEEGEQ